jgi:hypothetical protein
LDRCVWERQKARIPAAAQGNGPFPDWNEPAWDHPAKLLDAIRLWAPALARCLDQVKWPYPDDVQATALRLKSYDHPTTVRARRDRAKRQREQGPNTKVTPEESLDGVDAAADRALPEPLRDDWTRLLQEWHQWADSERFVYAFELAAQLIIEKTKPEQPYILEYAPPASDDDLSADYRGVGEARHERLGPYDFDIRDSLIRSPGGNWLPARILGGIQVAAKRMRTARLAREARDRAAVAAWGAECAKPMRERQYFRFGDIADALAKDPESLEINTVKRDRIVDDLSDWTIRGEFDLSGDSEGLVLSGEPPFFLPFGPVAPGGILADPEWLILRREACERYLRKSSLQRAPGLLRDWFPETEVAKPVIPHPIPPHPIPPKKERPVNPTLRAAVENAVKSHGPPGKSLSWKTFCDSVRSICGVQPNTRGYGDKSIERAVRAIKAEQDKHDKSDMSQKS